jgi:hypothetical protein
MKRAKKNIQWVALFILCPFAGMMAMSASSPAVSDSKTKISSNKTSNRSQSVGVIRDSDNGQPQDIQNLISEHPEEGYIRIGKIQIAWGREQTEYVRSKTGSATKTIKFPASFSNVPAITLGEEQASASQRGVYIVEATQTGFSVHYSIREDKFIHWIAIGSW